MVINGGMVNTTSCVMKCEWEDRQKKERQYDTSAINQWSAFQGFNDRAL